MYILPSRIDPDFRPVAYCYGVAQVGESDRFESLLGVVEQELATFDNNGFAVDAEHRAWLQALGCARSAELIERLG